MNENYLVKTVAGEMQHTVTQLIDLSRIDGGEVELILEFVSIREVVRATWETHKAPNAEAGTIACPLTYPPMMAKK